jgi:hypothetical protein
MLSQLSLTNRYNRNYNSKSNLKSTTIKNGSKQRNQYSRALKRKKEARGRVNTLFLIHGVLTNVRSIIPSNIELITFTPTGSSLLTTTAIQIMSILHRNSYKLNTIEFGTDSYRLVHPDGTGISHIHTHHYKPFDSYPEINLTFENSFGELDTLGFYDTTYMSLFLLGGVISSTGNQYDITRLFRIHNQIAVNTPFLLSTLLHWISQIDRSEHRIVRVYLLCCQGINPFQPPLVQNMELNQVDIDFSNAVNEM